MRLDMELGADRHLDDEQLEEYSLGLTPESALEAFEEHLLCCETCQRRLEESDQYVTAMRSAAAELQQAPPRAAWWWAFLRPAWGVVLAAVLVMAVVVWNRSSSGSAAAPLAVSLQAMRGAAVGSHAPAGRVLLLAPDVSGVTETAPYRVEVVTEAGKPVPVTKQPGDRTEATVGPLDSGTYYVRLYSASGQILREYGLRVQ
jgi:hypothetical protein